MAVIPLVQITKARVSKLAGVDFTLLSTPAFFCRNFDTSAVNPRAFRPYLDFG
jgi:hypothetical protein